MNKIKLIAPLLLVMPTLFACGGGSSALEGNYKIDDSINPTFLPICGNLGKTTYEEELAKGTCPSVFLTYEAYKTTIKDGLTAFGRGTAKTEGTINLTNKGENSCLTKYEGEQVKTYCANLKEDGDDNGAAYVYGQSKNGYHLYSLYQNNIIDNYIILNVIANVDSSSPSFYHLWLGNINFLVDGNSLNVKMAAYIDLMELKDGKRIVTPQYLLTFDVKATK